MTPVASLEIRCAVDRSRTPERRWHNRRNRVGLHLVVHLVCGGSASLPVGPVPRTVVCPKCSEAAQREAARRELHAPAGLVAMRCDRFPAYRDERAKLTGQTDWQRAHEAEQASGRPGVGVD